jgi:Salt tolerance down-regulator
MSVGAKGWFLRLIKVIEEELEMLYNAYYEELGTSNLNQVISTYSR